MYSNFLIEVTQSDGTVVKHQTRLGNGTFTSEQLSDHFAKHNAFPNAKSINITPIHPDDKRTVAQIIRDLEGNSIGSTTPRASVTDHIPLPKSLGT